MVKAPGARCSRAVVAAFAGTVAIGLAGCGDNSHGTTGFRTSLSSEQAEMTISGGLLWYWNEMPEANFQGWFTDPGTAWHETIAGAQLSVYQNATTQLGTRLALDNGDFEVNYTTVQLNPASRIVYPAANMAMIPLDRVQIGLDVGSAPTRCSLTDTRVIIALSSFPESADVLMDRARASAAAAGGPAPQSWADVVHDPAMYSLLFRDHATVGLATATFAYVTAYMLPTCGDRRLFFIAETDLIGPVVQDR